jgi:uncharacterized protein (DUF2147 family)
MKKTLLFCLLSFFLLADNIVGFWKSYDEKTNKPQLVVAVYPYQGMFYGKIIGIYDAKGQIAETLDHPKGRAKGLEGHPFYCGLDFVYNLKRSGSSFKGKIVDPEKGNVYNAEVWRKNQDLIVRGKLLFFGRNLTWYPFKDEEFNKTFPKPDTTLFKPKIPD